MRNLKDLPVGREAPDTVNAVIEIPRGSKNKYEYDVDLGIFRLDRVLYSAVHYPTAYGFIPQTLGDDGDPVDVLVMVDEELPVGVLLAIRPIGMLNMVDDKGGDIKILSVPDHDPRWDSYHDIKDVSKHRLVEIEHFFQSYKELEKKAVISYGWSGSHMARKSISEGMQAYKKKVKAKPVKK